MPPRVLSDTLPDMTRIFFASIATTLLAALAAPAAHAWGPTGHRLVAALAARELTPAASREVARLLRGEPEPTLPGVANWADDIREKDPALFRRTASWHYLDLAGNGCGYSPERDCPNGDCVPEAIRRQRALLADRRQPLAVRAQALKFIVHFVGDIHQPLHAGYASDRGGNDIQVNIDGRGSNLHRLWDSELIASAKLEPPAYLSRLLRQPLTSRAMGSPADWVQASCRIAVRDGVYPPSPKLDPAYFTQWRPVAEAQLRLAGHHLAQLLNRTL